MQKVYLYATCLGLSAYGSAVKSAVKLLNKADIEVIFKKDQTCCGQPSYNSGYFNESKKIALYNARLFNENYPILVPSGSCAGMMKEDYKELFHDDEHLEEITKFSNKIYELSNYLDQVLKLPLEDKGEKIKVVWHSNCHALRVAKSIESSKNLLRKLANVDLIELKHEEECCGFGGTFAVKEPEISNAMAQQKVQDIIESGAQYIISGDGGCLMNISGTLKRMKSDIKAIHLFDFLVKRIEGESL